MVVDSTILDIEGTAAPSQLAGTLEPAISVRGVGKMYRIYDRPQDRLKQMVWRGRRTYGREFWALRDVSFEAKRGETVGIIGRNGSGKSTLLQIIAGTLRPTEGEVSVRGRVAALLELGSGFNPEFTGRENVFLNGAILGLNRDEMHGLFDDIAAFADIGEFIDQPVKIYSSGMLVRLAFAVQAHLQPDILIVDEALSVGDVYFQHKCMRRIKDLVDRGTTLLFVSHSTETVKRFCRYGLWLDCGNVRYFGNAGSTAEKYLAYMRMREVQDWMPAAQNEAALQDSSSHALALEADDLPTLSAEHILADVSAEVDLVDERLFLRGSWDVVTVTDLPTPIRSSNDPTALAGFRSHGSRIDLTFLQGPDAGMVKIAIDGNEREIDLFHPTGRSVEKISYVVEPGDHTVLISSVQHRFRRNTRLYWLGGRISASQRLAFHRDPALGADNTEVERYGTAKARITAVELLEYVSQQPISELSFGQRVRLRIHAERLKVAGPRLEFSYIVRDRNRIDLFGTTTIDEHIRLDPHAERFVVEFAFDIHLGPGSYSILTSFVECSEDLSIKVPMDQIDITKVFTVTFNPSRAVWYIFHEPTVVNAVLYNSEGQDY